MRPGRIDEDEQMYLVMAFLHDHGYDIKTETTHIDHYAIGRIMAWQDVKTTTTITDKYSHEVFLEKHNDTAVSLWSHIRSPIIVDLHHPHSFSRILEYVRSHRTVLLEGL